MSTNKVVLGVLGGVAAGALLGILFAPEKGSKTRRKILDKGNDYADDLKGKFEDLLGTITEKYESVFQNGQELVREGKDLVNEGKSKYNEVKKEIKEINL